MNHQKAFFLNHSNFCSNFSAPKEESFYLNSFFFFLFFCVCVQDGQERLQQSFLSPHKCSGFSRRLTGHNAQQTVIADSHVILELSGCIIFQLSLSQINYYKATLSSVIFQVNQQAVNSQPTAPLFPVTKLQLYLKTDLIHKPI